MGEFRLSGQCLTNLVENLAELVDALAHGDRAVLAVVEDGPDGAAHALHVHRPHLDSQEVVSSLKLVNVWGFVQLISSWSGSPWSKNQLHKNPNIAQLETSHYLYSPRSNFKFLEFEFDT